MEPELPSPRYTPEQAPVREGESMEQRPYSSPEARPESAPEPLEQRSESGARAAEAAPLALPTPVFVPSTAQGSDDDDSAGADDDSPLVANDDDLIEKEWVDKAKQIIAETRDDPHRREEAISRLQADYLRKRYGKELDTSK